MKQNEIDLLVELLARQDAVFIPFRQPSSAWWPHGWLLRGGYHTAGLPWKPKAGDEAEQKAAVRALHSLVRLGLVRSDGKAKALCFRLTDRGDQFARALLHADWGIDAG